MQPDAQDNLPASTIAGVTIKSAVRQLRSWRPGGLARDTAYASAWSVSRIALQALNLILLARLFGADGFGALAGSIAFFATWGQFVGLGTGIVLVRDASRSNTATSDHLARAQSVYLLTGIAFFSLTFWLGQWLFASLLPMSAVAAIALAEVVAAPGIMPLAYRLQSQERMNAFGLVLSIPPTIRLAAILTLMALDSTSIVGFTVTYAGCMLGVTVLLNAQAGFRWPRRSDLSYLRQGIGYVVPSVASTAGGELDKTIVLQLAGASTAGIYAAAYRLAQAASIPVQSLILAGAARLFRAGDRDAHRSTFKPFLLSATLFGILAGTGLFAIAPVLPYLLGHAFQESVALARMLSVFVLTSCVRQMVMAWLTTSNLQGARNFSEVTAMFSTLLICAALVAEYSASGAVVALIAGDTAAVASAAIAIVSKKMRSKRI